MHKIMQKNSAKQKALCYDEMRMAMCIVHIALLEK